MATVAASGPKSSTELMKNVSAIEMLASIAAMRMTKDPVRNDSAANADHSSGCGTRSRLTSEYSTTALPTAVTVRM